MEIFDRKLSGMCLIEWVKERGGEERKKKKKRGMKIFAVKPNRKFGYSPCNYRFLFLINVKLL